MKFEGLRNLIVRAHKMADRNTRHDYSIGDYWNLADDAEDALVKLLAVAEASMALCNALTPEERASEALFPEYRDLKEAIDALEGK